MITKTDDPDPVAVGGTLTYTKVTNQSTVTATGVQVADSLPTTVTFVSVATSQGSCTGGALVSCSLGTISPGGSVTITIVVRPNSPGTILNTATVVGNDPESNTANNTATQPTLVQGPFVPPAPPSCQALVVRPKTLLVGRRHVLVAVVTTQGGRPMRRVRVIVRGAGLSASGLTNANGVARIGVKPKKPGIARVSVVNQPRCGVQRVGLIGVFRPPVSG